MAQTPLERLRAALPHPLVPDGQVGGQYRTNCPGPGHKNGNHHNPALSVTETTPGGKVLINCHVGCSPEDTVAAINLKLSDLFPADGEVQTLTIEEYSRKKRLPLDFLRKRGVSQYGKALLFRYYCKDGKEARSQLRLRSGKQPWKKDDHREIEPYGLDLLGDSEYAALVEGCSDGLTLQLAGFSVIGIPGNTMQSKLKAEHIAGIKRAYITREFKGEGDTSGDTFVRLTRRRLRRLGFKGETFVVDMETLGAGDPSDLYISDTVNFPIIWQKALDDAASEPEGDEVQPLSLGGPPIPPAVYEALPSDIRKVCLLLREGHERDVFLTGLLPVLSAALLNLLTKYGRRWKALALNTAVVAPAGAGKSPMQLAGDCAEDIDARLRQESADARAVWAELDEDGRKSTPQPPERSLRLAVDTSTRGLLDNLAANGGRGLLFETEIKTLADTFRQDWGSFKSILLKAAEQEVIERVRKGEEKLFIPKPELPMAISGTPAGFTEWIGSTEDGIFSRFLYYAFDAKPEWVDQFDDDEDETLDKALAKIGERLDKMHEALSGRVDDEGKPIPLYFRFEREQRKRLNAVFSRRLQAVNVTDRPELFASVKRGAFQAVRIAGVLAAYRLHAAGKNLGKVTSYVPNEDEVDAAITLVCCYLDHAAALGLRFEQDPRAKIKNEQWWTFFEALPREFTTAKAHEIGEGLTMSRSGVERALRTLTERHGLFTRLCQGRYQKVSFMADGLTEATEATEAKEVGPENEGFPSVPSVPSLPSGPSIPSERQNGRNETPGDDGASTDESALVWDEDDQGGDPE